MHLDFIFLGMWRVTSEIYFEHSTPSRLIVSNKIMQKLNWDFIGIFFHWNPNLNSASALHFRTQNFCNRIGFWIVERSGFFLQLGSSNFEQCTHFHWRFTFIWKCYMAHLVIQVSLAYSSSSFDGICSWTGTVWQCLKNISKKLLTLKKYIV